VYSASTPDAFERGSAMSRLSRGGLFVLASLLVLVLAEVLLRGWVYSFRDPSERFDRQTQTFALVPGEYPRNGRVLRVNPEGLAGRDLVRDASLRIATLGDSCTLGEGDGEISYPAMLGRRLAADGSGVEVLNAGLAGLDAEQLERRLESVVLPLGPDLVLILAGWNDLMKRSPLSQGSTEGLAGWSRAIDDLWLIRGLRKAMFFWIRSRFGKPVTGAAGETGRFRDFRPQPFEASLRGMISISRAAGAEVHLLTLPSVLRRDMLAYDLETARVVFPYFLSGNRLGDTMDLIEAYNRSIRRISVENGVPLIDLAARFETLDSTRGYFLDTMHPSALGMDLMAETVERELRAHGALRRKR
jgi:lysophospholipase L1-like esterase